MRYILALIPEEQNRLAYLEAAQVFAGICDGYLLGENSIPHVTLCSFACDDPQILFQPWQAITCPIRPLGLHLKKGQTPPNHYSLGITIARDIPLLDLHNHVIAILEGFKITPLNPSRDLYQPHLTLAGIRWEPSTSLQLSPILDALLSKPSLPFRLALGLGDDIGQYLKTLKT